MIAITTQEKEDCQRRRRIGELFSSFMVALVPSKNIKLPF